jgi:shikimate kinase
MSSGKSTIGIRVAERLGVPFLDTDHMVITQSGKTIGSFFHEGKEDEFRIMEAGVLRETALFPKALVATGGGLPAFHRNMEWLTENGITMYLQWPDDLLLENVLKNKSGRPLLSGLPESQFYISARKMLEERKIFYEQSSMTLDMSGDLEKDVALVTRACQYIW